MAELRLAGGRRLRSPIGQFTRPTTARVREAVMNILGPQLRGSHWLDLCSGSGAVACEALQHGVQNVVAVEKNRRVAAVCRMNLEAVCRDLSREVHLEVVRQDAIYWLMNGNKSRLIFDFVYLDPPYRGDLYRNVLNVLLTAKCICASSLVICEHATDLPLVAPLGWHECDRRHYGSSALLFLSQPPSVLPRRY